MFVLNFKEVCEFFGNSENTVKQKFKRKQEEYDRKGITVVKTGRGMAAKYELSINSNWFGEIPSTIEGLKAAIEERDKSYQLCYGCKKYLTGATTRLSVPSASGKSEIMAYCCEDCLEEYHFHIW